MTLESETALAAEAAILVEIDDARKTQRTSNPSWNDDNKTDGELAGAAACYLLHHVNIRNVDLKTAVKAMVLRLWPFAPHYWQPQSRRQDLIKSAALVVAEIARLDRKARMGSMIASI